MPAPGQAKKVAMLGSLDTPQAPTHCPHQPDQPEQRLRRHLKQLDQLYGPKPGQPTKPFVLVEDNGPIHTSKLSPAALATRAHWLTIGVVAQVCPELNDIGVMWHDHLAHQTLADTDALDPAIHQAVDALNMERMVLPPARPRITP